MTKANDSVNITAGTGTPIAVHLIDAKKHQVMMLANPNGSLIGDIPTYSAYSGSLASAVNKPFMHLFNAAGSGAIVKVRKVFIQPSMAVNALAAQTWRIAKTSAVGTTGNTAVTIRPADSANPAVPALVTAAHSFTAGGTQAFTYFDIALSVEETLPGVHMTPWQNILPTDGDMVSDYVLREGEGLSVINVTGGTYNWSVLAVASIE